MAKNNVTQYDTTAANNTDVGGISIAEGMSPSNVNNAMRELMKHTADWVSGSQAITKLTTTGDIELGHASDTTISRSSAGTVTIEGAEIRTGTVAVANGGTGATSLSAANIVTTDAQNTFTKAQVPSTYTAALSATSGVLDYDTYTNFIITLASGSNTLAAPTTEASQIGQTGVIIFIQPSSGSAGTLSLHGDYETAGAAGITLSSANNDYDVVPYFIKANDSILLGAPQLNFG
jgi:hypothetical protein